MTRTMYDSINVADDPLNAQLVAYYCDGDFAVSAATVRARFPNAVLVPISAVGTNSGIVGDVEPGCMSPDYSVGWVQERRRAGVDPSLYVNETYGWVVARKAFAAAGVAEPHWWVADYDGIAVIPPGAVAKQYENAAQTGGHFDKSIVADFWPGVDGLAGGGSGQLGENVNLSEKIAHVREANGTVGVFFPTDGSQDQAIIAVAEQIADDGSNCDTIIKAIVNSANGLVWQQIAADLRAGKYALAGAPVLVPHKHPASEAVAD